MQITSSKKTPATSKYKVCSNKKVSVYGKRKKYSKKLTRAQYDDLRQIEWVPFDPYAD